MPLKSLHAHPALRLFRRMMPDLLVHLRDVANGCVRILFLRNQARLADVAGGDDGLEHAVFLCPNLDLVLMHCFSSLVDQPPPLATGFYDYYASFNTNLSPRQSFSPFFAFSRNGTPTSRPQMIRQRVANPFTSGNDSTGKTAVPVTVTRQAGDYFLQVLLATIRRHVDIGLRNA